MYEKIPKELQELKRWGAFRKIWKPERNKYTKIPVDPLTGHGGKSNDESTWTDFSTALEAVGRLKLDGLAFYFKPPYVGIDVDHVKDSLDAYSHGDEDNIVGDFINHTNSYTETSVSNEGLHIIVKSKINGDKRRHKNCEMYENGRFFALTGSFYGKASNDVIRDANVDYLYKKYIDPQEKVVNLFKNDFQPNDNQDNNLNTNDIIKAAVNSKSGERFRRLYKGEWNGLYSSQSEADLAFANDLAFWTAKDFSKMDSIFRDSGLMRAKYDERHGKVTYGVGLLNKAIADASQTYHPQENPSDNFYLSIPGVNDSKKSKPKKSKIYSYDDTGNAERFFDKYSKIAKYDTTNKKYMYFDGHVWQFDNTFVVERLFNKIVKDLGKEELHLPEGYTDDDEQDAKKIRGKFIKRSRQNAGKNGALAEIKKIIPATPDDFDKEVNIVNTPSGYVDLSNGEIHETTYKSMFTKITSAEYSPTAESPHWLQFLDETFEGNKDLIHFIQKAVGYTLTGTMNEQVMMIMHGKGGDKNGANGKSVFIETLREAIGDYAVTINPEVLLVNKFGGTDNTLMSELYETKGSRMIVTSETDSDVRLSESLIKRMTGGEAITAKKLYADPYTFMPTGTIWMSTNNKPIVRGTDHGIWRRLLFIPFLAQISDAKKDPNLKAKLLREKAGILNWAVDGALLWQKEGLNPPAIVTNENEEYREEMDTVGLFIEDVAEKGTDNRVSFKDIAGAWDDWESIHGTGMSKNKLSRELAQRFNQYRTSNSRGYIGLQLKKQNNSEWVNAGYSKRNQFNF